MSRSRKVPVARKFVADEQQCDTVLGGVDAVDRDLVVDGHQSHAVAPVERLAQIGERLPAADERRARVAERRDPAAEVTGRVQPVVSRVQVEDGRPPGHPVQHELLLVCHRHVLVSRPSG